MNDQILVSIIIPCFNKGKYIEETLASVYNQTYTKWECVVVDDGSTDQFTKIILGSINHPNVTVFFRTNEGVSAARNFAIEKSVGEFIVPLDADDILHHNFLLETVCVLQRDDEIKVVGSQVILFGKRNGVMKLPVYTLPSLLARNSLVVTCLFRRNDYKLTNGYNEDMKEGFEDWNFWIDLLKSGGKVYIINKPLFFYRISRNSRNHSLNDTHYRELRQFIYQNHKDVYSQYLLNPYETFEYELIINSMEYRVGKLLVYPFRMLKEKFFN